MSFYWRLLMLASVWVVSSRASPVPFDPSQDHGVSRGRTRSSPTGSSGGSVMALQEEDDASQYAALIQDQRKRDKQMRLLNIKNYVLSSLGYGKLPSSESKVGEGTETSERPFSGQLHTFHPSCDVPGRVESDMWTSPDYFHIFFNLTAEPGNLTRRNGSDSSYKTTLSAKLRIFKLGLGPDTKSTRNETREQGSHAGSEQNVSDALIETGGPLSEELGVVLVQEKIRVSLYWYRAPVTKYHYKKKLLDTKMLSAHESKWVEFDIINAAVPWLEERQENFGLVLQVENEDNDLVDPHKYFVSIPCAPSTRNLTEGLRTPVLEICTLSSPGVPSSREVEPQEPSSFFPFPMGQSFSYLSRVAKAHAQHAQAATANSGLTSDWQNDERRGSSLNSQNTDQGQNRHRHRHGSSRTTNQISSVSKPARQPSSSPFRLPEDHPLRQILESNVQESRARSGLSRDKYLESKEDEESDVIIQKIYITSPNQDSLNR